MEMLPVKSSNIDQVGYESDTKVLRIAFKNGRIYDYFEVPQEIIDGLRATESAGKFAADNIYPRFKQQRVK